MKKIRYIDELNEQIEAINYVNAKKKKCTDKLELIDLEEEKAFAIKNFNYMINGNKCLYY